jgi:cytidine deaminase
MITEKERQNLIRQAMDIRQHAYAPYSKYKVGAALLSTSGRVFTGVNIENAAYSVTICAERTAVFKAVSEGDRSFSAVAIVTDDGGSPCGSCRQVLSEFGLDTRVLLLNGDGELLREQSVSDLLPGAFTSDSLSF